MKNQTRFWKKKKKKKKNYLSINYLKKNNLSNKVN